MNRALLVALAIAGLASPSLAQQPLSPAAERLKKDVYFLADDERGGRLPGTPGIEQAAQYIAGRFEKLGLKHAPGAQGYFQPFDVQSGYVLTEPATLGVTANGGKAIAADPKTDVSALAVGGGGILNGLPIVWAGYGITAKDENLALDYNDYEGVDPKGKIVLLLRRAPQADDPKGPFSPRLDDKGNPLPGRQPNMFAAIAHKVTNAFSKGAKAVLIVNDRGSLKDGKDVLPGFEEFDNRRFSNVPVAFVSRKLADKLLQAGGQPSLAAVEDAYNGKELKPHSAVLNGLNADLTVAVERKKTPTKNVVAVLEGSGPLADETIVIGAHYDHVGRGEYGSLAGSKEIHNGADDNASGTATLMELARRLASRPDPLPRRVVFLAFSAEEAGLLGSQHYVDNPLYPLDKTIYMINFDMVGRLDDDNALHIYGAWTSPVMDDLVEALAKTGGFTPKMVAGTGEYFGASDHASFFQKGLPVLFFFTNVHPDYHRPSDDADKINYPGMARIADLGELLAIEMARRPSRPEFLKKPQPRPTVATAATAAPAKPESSDPHAAAAATPGAEPGGVVSSAYLGSIPDYGDEGGDEGKGVRLGGVMDGSPAEKAGLKKGDVVIKFAGKPVGTLQDYTEYLKASKPGDKVAISVRRGADVVTFEVVLGTRGAPAKQ